MTPEWGCFSKCFARAPPKWACPKTRGNPTCPFFRALFGEPEGPCKGNLPRDFMFVVGLYVLKGQFTSLALGENDKKASNGFTQSQNKNKNNETHEAFFLIFSSTPARAGTLWPVWCGSGTRWGQRRPSRRWTPRRLFRLP